MFSKFSAPTNDRIVRSGNRAYNDLRELKVTYDVFPYAAGSALFEIGNTKILCAITLQNGVPHFLRGRRCGWLTAEYSLLPASTPTRTVRESTTNKRNGRNIEISRLIGRALRSIVRLDAFNERTIFIDCDVLQADGGTRTASIVAAYMALRAAQVTWYNNGDISELFLRDELAAISVGTGDRGPILDMDFNEDSITESDFNFVITRAGGIVEIQGSAEKRPISWESYENVQQLALLGTKRLFEFYDQNLYTTMEKKSLLFKSPGASGVSFEDY
jgi:ribonuclease PH